MLTTADLTPWLWIFFAKPSANSICISIAGIRDPFEMGEFGPMTTRETVNSKSCGQDTRRHTEVIWHVRHGAGKVGFRSTFGPPIPEVYPITTNKRIWWNICCVVSGSSDDDIHLVRGPVTCDKALFID